MERRLRILTHVGYPVKLLGGASVPVLYSGPERGPEERAMRNPLFRRLGKIEGSLDMAAVSPERVRAALARWEDSRELPDDPKLRAIIERINSFIRQMEIATCGHDAPPGSLA